ncbi:MULTISPECIES: glycosyltransferase [Gluconobacter]|uniref:Glycosyltransferase family 2 protein n=1 Tax=Gluconobacter cadivus TaxID=2728101 RepID=A0ABR9YW61_9PROT|nr:glycosyltransferase family 2 protein [Gluconobacter cadivus]MBF0888781.1 glycosyltransferase family 2 protein [Gluconobacter cadivus]MBS1059865.1 glycosyltransferase family 2 protein [Gluconobacter sp. Dm-44]
MGKIDCVVSVIIPAYNAEDFIEQAVHSVLKQTMSNFEIIIVNDASRDKTREKSLKLCELDERIIYFENAKNLGVSESRNFGIRKSKAKYIAILDSDDLWREDRLSIMIEHMEKNNLDMLADQLVVLTENSRENAFSPEWMKYNKYINIFRYMSMDWPGLQKTMPLCYMKPVFRKEFILKENIFYDKELSIGEDSLFYSCMVVAGAKFMVIPDALYFYTVRDGSLSKINLPALQLMKIPKKIMEFCISRNIVIDRKIQFAINAKYQSYLLKHSIDLMKNSFYKKSILNLMKIQIGTYVRWAVYFIKLSCRKFFISSGFKFGTRKEITPPFISTLRRMS